MIQSLQRGNAENLGKPPEKVAESGEEKLLQSSSDGEVPCHKYRAASYTDTKRDNQVRNEKETGCVFVPCFSGCAVCRLWRKGK